MSSSVVRRMPRELIALYWDSGVANDVPALAWFLLSSLVPLALGVTALATLVLGDFAQAQALSVQISKVLPKDVHDQIVELILRTRHETPLLIVGAIAGSHLARVDGHAVRATARRRDQSMTAGQSQRPIGYSMAAWAAAIRAIGTRNGEQDT